jgi:hypothetical protein
MTLLARNPDHRYPSGAATRLALQAASLGHLDQTTELTPPSGNPVVPTDTTPIEIAKAPASQPARREGRRLLAILVALGVAAATMLWSVSRNDVVIPSDDAPEVLSAPVGPVAISTITSYDPNGDDGEENEALTPLLLDSNPETTWMSTCYANQYFGSKEYVGLVVQLNQPAIGTLQIAMANAPWTIEVYQALDNAPFTLAEWGARTDRKFNTKRRGSAFDIVTPAQYLLVVFREAGRGPSCSNANPYQSIVSGVSFQQG